MKTKSAILLSLLAVAGGIGLYAYNYHDESVPYTAFEEHEHEFMRFIATYRKSYAT